MAPTDKRISLGVALVAEAEAAGDCYVPTEPMPGPWVDLFEAEHADGAVWHGLSTSCRGGRDWTLRRAPKVKLALDCRFKTEAEAGNALSRHQKHTQPLIETRMAQQGAAPPELLVRCWDMAASASGALGLLQALAQNAPHTSVMTIEFSPVDVASADMAAAPLRRHPEAILAGGITKFPSLTTLTVHNCPTSFPAPPRLPNVRHLTVTMSHRDEFTVLPSLAPFLPQLTSLNVYFGSHCHDYYDSWTFLRPRRPHVPLTPGPPTLTSLTTNAYLNDGLVSFIQKHTPAVRKLRVGGFTDRRDPPDLDTWAVEEIHVAHCEVANAEDIAGLPGREDESSFLTFDCPECRVRFDVEDPAGLDADVRQRLSTWRLQVKNIDLHLDRQELEDGELHDALRNALQQLGTLHDPPPVYIRYKQEVKPALPWTPELLRVLAEAPRNIPRVKAAVRVDGPLTDELLTSVLHNGRHVHSLSVASVSLQSDTYANTPWPWEEFTCDTVDVSQPVIWQIVTKQPNLSAVRDVTEHTTEIVIPADVTGSVEDCLRRTQWKVSYITLRCIQDDQAKQAKLLRMAREMRVINSKYVDLRLSGWPMTRATIETWGDATQGLSNLPTYADTLDLTHCTEWPLTLEEYVALFKKHVLTRHYRVWYLPNTPLHKKLASAFVATKLEDGRGWLSVHLGCFRFFHTTCTAHCVRIGSS